MGERLRGLDALRGIAALIVAASHAATISGEDPFLGQRFYLAVDFFFLLSGFILARTYEARMPSPASFMLKRYKRLWPPIAIGSLIGAGLYMVHGWPAWVAGFHLALALAFLPFSDGVFWLNRPAWSIFFEVVANVVHAAVLWRLPAPVLLVVVACCAAWLLVPSGIGATGQETLFWYGFPRVLMTYTLGIVIWRVNGDTGRFPAWLGYLGLPAMVVAAGFLPDRADVLLVLLACPAILLAGLSESPRMGGLLGALSFPLYALHWPVVFSLSSFGVAWVPALAVSVALAVLLAMVSDRTLLARTEPSRQAGR